MIKMSYMTKNKLYSLQDKVLKAIYEKLAPTFKETEIVFSGGTALSRFYLKHRVSYDLDFFLTKAFDPSLLEHRLKMLGLPLRVTGFESTETFAAQLHGVLSFSKSERLKLSFVEDVFAGMFETVLIDGVKTEGIDSLFHRKLRTIAGTGTATSLSGHLLGIGNRQTARDLFDLYVLDTTHEQIDSFISRINQQGARFPEDLFKQNLSSVPWLDLFDEMELLEVLPPVEKMSSIELKRHFDDVLKRLS